MLVGDILDDSSGADSKDHVQESGETDITNETESPAMPKSTTSATSTVDYHHQQQIVPWLHQIAPP